MSTKTPSLLNWIIIIIAGITVGILTIYFIPAQWEILVWILLILMIGLYTGRKHTNKIFTNAFRNAFVMGITITMTHLKFIDDYFLSHPEELLLIENTFGNFSKTMILLMIAPVYWVILGVLSGLVALLLKKTLK
jgi:hypothetical protein